MSEWSVPVLGWVIYRPGKSTRKNVERLEKSMDSRYEFIMRELRPQIDRINLLYDHLKLKEGLAGRDK